jgi:O-antigen ligase
MFKNVKFKTLNIHFKLKIKNYPQQKSDNMQLPRVESLLFYLLVFFLPTQLGKHFWPDFSYVLGLRIDYLSPTLYMTDILVGLLFTAWIFRKLKQKPIKSSKLKVQNSKLSIRQAQDPELIEGQLKIQKYSSLLIYASVVSYLLLVIVLSGRMQSGLYSLVKFLEMSFLAYYTAKFIVSRRVFENAVRIFSASIVFQSLLAIAQFLRQGSIGGLLYYVGERSFAASTPGIANASLNGELVLRPYGTLPHPNVLAGYLVVVMTMVLYSLFNRRQKKVLSSKYYVLSSVSLVLGTIALLLCMSRVAIILWVLIAVYYLFQKTRKTRKFGGIRSSEVQKVRLAGLLSILSILIIFFLTPLAARFTNLNMSDKSIVQRGILMDRSLEMLKTSPLFGVGLGNFIPTLAQSQMPLTVTTQLQPAHNIFLLVAAETGLIGLGFFVWFLWKTFRRIKNYESRSKELLYVLFFVILITGMGDHYWLTLQQGQLLFAFVIGLCYNPSLYGRNT